MKFDINNPAFLQAACCSPSLPTIVARSSSESAEFEINKGESTTVFITRTLNGELSTFSEEIDSSGYISVSCDPNTDIIIRGDLISLSDDADNGFYENLEYLDISKCRSLEVLNLGSALPKLGEIKMRATSTDVADGIATAIESSQLEGIVYLKQGDKYNNRVLTAAQDLNWEVRYF